MARREDDGGLYKALGQRAAALRRARGWTQEKLAEGIGVASVTVSRWETGQRGMTLVTLARLATVLEISLGDLLDVERESPEPVRDPLEQELVVRWRDLEERDRGRMVEIVRLMART